MPAAEADGVQTGSAARDGRLSANISGHHAVHAGFTAH
jgi:hypothetical protein